MPPTEIPFHGALWGAVIAACILFVLSFVTHTRIGNLGTNGYARIFLAVGAILGAVVNTLLH